MISLIFASTKSGLIGKNNKLPWYLPEELRFFKQTTLNHTLLMGRYTYLSLPKKLVDREILVLSRHHLEGVKTVTKNELSQIFRQFRNDPQKNLFIAGGKTLYEEYYHEAQFIYHSVLKNEYEGNIYLNLNLSNYKLINKKVFSDFIVYIYKKTHKM